jgi:hypothetical protein
MIDVVIAMMLQSAAADGARSALRGCIKQAAVEAKAQKVAPAAFAGFAQQKCAAHESSFKSAMWSFDSKNKVPRKQSEADASVQIEDFMAVAADRYAAENAPK